MENASFHVSHVPNEMVILLPTHHSLNSTNYLLDRIFRIDGRYWDWDFYNWFPKLLLQQGLYVGLNNKKELKVEICAKRGIMT